MDFWVFGGFKRLFLQPWRKGGDAYLKEINRFFFLLWERFFILQKVRSRVSGNF